MLSNEADEKIFRVSRFTYSHSSAYGNRIDSETLGLPRIRQIALVSAVVRIF